ncbi:hypothetical protein CAEBREN_12343 [Caenorhabditis brenneri]|uniref:Uncharacterized protein n=1 Tax=Caenorhabditis brenneri TaxID=135651 RepID=G0N3D7_CAEBE|nr:hypothetical protein CAEBREN_12343 [Caenorhabditis brenneri]
MHRNFCCKVTPKCEEPDSFSGMVVKTECPIEIFDEKKVKIEEGFQNFLDKKVPQKTSRGLTFRVESEQDAVLEKVQTLNSLMTRKIEIPESFLNMVIKSEFPEEERNAGAVVKTPIMEEVKDVQGPSEIFYDKVSSESEKVEEEPSLPSASSLVRKVLESEHIHLKGDIEKQLLAAIGIKERQVKQSPTQKKKRRVRQRKASVVQAAPSETPKQQVSPGAPAKDIPDLRKYMRVVPAFGAKRGLGAPRYIVRPGVNIEYVEPLEKKSKLESVVVVPELQELQKQVDNAIKPVLEGPRIQLQKAVAISKRYKPVLKEKCFFPAKRDPEQERLLKLKPVEKLVLRPPTGENGTQKCASSS